jgi:Gram-negative bacterial TonB protein C-terminal
MTLFADESSSAISGPREWGQSAAFSEPRELREDRRVPGFLVPPERLWAGASSSLRAIFAAAPLPTSMKVSPFFHHVDIGRFKWTGQSLTASFVVHCASLVLLLQFPYAAAMNKFSHDSVSDSQERIYYSISVLDTAKPLPRIQPRGQGAHPDAGQFPHLRPAIGSTASNRALAAVSNPLRPDNTRQTIVQPSSPPNLKITAELKLPNIIDGMVSSGPKAPSQLYAKMVKPIAANRQLASVTAPTLAIPAPATPLSYLPDAGNLSPRLPVTPLAAPSRSQVSTSASAPVPNIDTSGVSGAAADGGGLFIMSVDPAPPSAQLALPPGNRSGAFSVSPEDGLIGSPSGTATGAYGGGSGAGDEGGDKSTGPGTGAEGGGGGPSASEGTISAKFIEGPAAMPGALDPAFAASMVFPVFSSMLPPRKNAFVVAAGPIGGGGLDVYGALHCGKIYTIFLSMPGKSWTLQYCEHQDTPSVASSDKQSASTVSVSGGTSATPSSTTVTRSSPATAIVLPSPLVPPDPQARFDFKRLQVPQDKTGKMIVLKGTLQPDGTVDGLKVYQGVVPEMDEAARLAFARWKFNPAMRAGKPIALDILVGISLEAAPAPGAHPSATSN